MSIDIESLSYEELLELQHMITQRLKAIDSGKSAKVRWKFNQGDKVSFSHPTLGLQTGTLLAHHERTATVITHSGQKWDVSPHLLRKVVYKEKQVNKVYKIPDQPEK